MVGDRSADSAGVDLEQARRIHAVCEEFECRWRGGGRPRIEELVEKAPNRRPARAPGRALDPRDRAPPRRRRGPPSGRIPRLAFPTAEGRVEAAFAQAAGASRASCKTADRAQRRSVAATIRMRSKTDSIFEVIGDYEVLEEIARGGMGVVYKARQRGANRLVALKMILSGQMASADERERFLREAELAANLDHQHIVPIYEVDEFQGCPFFSMKLIEGESLSHQIKAKKRAGPVHDPQTAAGLMATIARAVHYAHERGFLHCDLKPSNILLDREGRPYVTDFGLAKRASEDSAVSISGAIMGTPSYMAPEQASGSRKGLRPTTDVYGLGAIFYELLTARPRFVAETVPETVVAVLERDPIPPRELSSRGPQGAGNDLLEVPGEIAPGSLCLGRRPGRRARSLPSRRGHRRDHAHPPPPPLEPARARAGRPARRALARRPDRSVQLLLLIGRTAVSGTITRFRGSSPSGQSRPSFSRRCCARAGSPIGSACSGRRPTSPSSRSSSSYSSSSRPQPAAMPMVRVETTLLVGYPLLIAASGLWWRVNSSGSRPRWRCPPTAGSTSTRPCAGEPDGSVSLEPEPRPATPQYLPGGAASDRLRRRPAGQAHLALEQIL